MFNVYFALVENQNILNTVTDNVWEQHFLIYSGKTASEIISASHEPVNQFKTAGVNKFILSVGTADLLQLPIRPITTEHRP